MHIYYLVNNEVGLYCFLFTVIYTNWILFPIFVHVVCKLRYYNTY